MEINRGSHRGHKGQNPQKNRPKGRCKLLILWSGREDLNLRLPAPKANTPILKNVHKPFKLRNFNTLDLPTHSRY